jgi:hypothetical protein
MELKHSRPIFERFYRVDKGDPGKWAEPDWVFPSSSIS